MDRPSMIRKKALVKEFAKLIDTYPIVGVVDVTGLPAKQLQIMREKLRGKVILKMTKVKMLRMALEQSSKKDIQLLEPYVDGIVMALFSKDNPFSLYKTLKANKSSAPAKAGQIAPKEIIVPKGGTGIPPGPMISQLAQVGVKAGVEAGKIAVKEDSKVADEGDEISSELAEVLSRLGIEPMEIGLNLKAIFENGEILTRTVLDIDEELYMNNLKSAYHNSFALAMEIGFLTQETVTPMIEKAYREAVLVGIEGAVLSKDLIDKIIQKAQAESNSLNKIINGDNEPKAETKPEEKKEEKKEEESASGLGALFG